MTFTCVRLLRCCGAASHPVKGGSILQRCFLPLGYLFVPVCFWFGAAELRLPRHTSAFSADDAQICPARLLPLVPRCWAGLHCLQVCLRGRFYVWQHSTVFKSTLKCFCSDLALVAVGRRYCGGPFCCNSHAVPPVGCRIPPPPPSCAVQPLVPAAVGPWGRGDGGVPWGTQASAGANGSSPFLLLQ